MKIIVNNPTPPPPPPATYDIVGLTKDEATALLYIIACVGGEPNGPRAAVDRLWTAFHDAGLKHVDNRSARPFLITGSLSLEPRPV